MKLLIILYFSLMSLFVSANENEPFTKITHHGMITENHHFEQAISELKSAKLLEVKNAVYEALQNFIGVEKVDRVLKGSLRLDDITEIKFDSKKIPFHYMRDFNDSQDKFYAGERTTCIILTHGNMKKYKDILDGKEDQYPFKVIKKKSRILRTTKFTVQVFVILADQLRFVDIKGWNIIDPNGWNTRYRVKIRLNITLNKNYYDTLRLMIREENSKRETEIQEDHIYDNNINMDKERKTESEDSGNVTNKVEDSQESVYATLDFESTDSSGNNKVMIDGLENENRYSEIMIELLKTSLVKIDNF